MNNSKSTSLKFFRAEKARRNFLKLQNAPSTPALADLTKPNVLDIVDINDGTLHKDALKKNLTVQIPQWHFLPPPGSGPSDFSTLQLQFTLTGAEHTFVAIGPVKRFDPPIVPEDFPLTLEFPQESIPRNGKLWVRYELIDHLGDKYVSLPIELICDSVAPWGDDPAPPLLPPNEIINERYLVNHPEGIELDLPDYQDRAPGDTYHVFYLKEWSEEDTDYENPAAAGAVTDDLKVILPADSVRLLGDGRFYIVYYLFDKARNRSRIRLPATIDVVVTPEPANLPRPEVPLATNDGVLSLDEAHAGVTVEIGLYTNRNDNDKILVTWGSTVLQAEQVGTRPIPIKIAVPIQVLRDEYGKATGVVPTNVSYKVLRHHAPYGPADDDFNVDLSIAGPERPDPDPTWPVNPALLAPTITSFTGLENEIALPDRGQDATLTFDVYPDAANGQVVDFYWKGTLVTEARWVVDQATGTEKSVTIPWSYIERAGNDPALPVHYTVRASLTAINEQESSPRYVHVTAIDMTPDDLAFHGLTDRGWLSCPSIWDPVDPAAAPAIRVWVPPCSGLFIEEETTITLSWLMYNETVGGDLIAGVEKQETLTLTADQISNGFIWRVEPYLQHIQPIFKANPQGGRAQVSYVINTIPPRISRPTENRISMSDQSTNGSCDLTRP
ncbi:hypothetical protein GIB19_20710 [Pseudomonas sp. ITEM 17296]|uniref:hypothetical protein n=1 Tax=Pseudomonas sp. ITEM 17296 TaxID=2790281 RepID=UPI0023801FBE|nr:hypothetical protein [Pseudomonas sp. ITEM 17296]MDE4539626.1 hypothetical protein [Pseudomonas sp. ITEM 17296]